MAKVDGGELVARIIQENKARYCFAINGGHLFPILAQLRSHEIKLVHMRHEQATAYAADPARTGNASKPVPIIPRLKSSEAKTPAIGRSASAAWAAVSIWVFPWA